MPSAVLPPAKPADVFDRIHEWDDLAGFAAGDAPGLRIAVHLLTLADLHKGT